MAPIQGRVGQGQGRSRGRGRGASRGGRGRGVLHSDASLSMPQPFEPDIGSSTPQPANSGSHGASKGGRGRGVLHSDAPLSMPQPFEPDIDSPTPQPANLGSHGAQSTSIDEPIDPPGGSTEVPLTEESRVGTNRKLIISVETNAKRFVQQGVTHDITSTIFMRMPIPAEKWKHYPVAMKDLLFKEFMDKYEFASDYDRSMARTVWDRTCQDRYPDLLNRARLSALRDVGSTNIADTKDKGPKGMKSEVWNGLVDIWLTDKWLKKSEAGRKNRASMPEEMLHTAGSISFGQHKRNLEAKRKKPVPFRDLYDHTHKKKDGKYVSKRAENFIDSYDSAILEKYGEDSSSYPLVDPDLWVECSGANKKGRVHGIGHSLDIDLQGKNSFSSTSSSSFTKPVTQEDITAAVNAAMFSFVQTQLIPIISRIPGYRGETTAPQAPTVGEETEENQDDHINGRTNLD